MNEEIEFITTQEIPEVKVRIAIFPCLDEKFNNNRVIIIPGWLSAIDNFTPMAEAMQKYAETIIYEPRGYGKSIPPHKRGLFSPEQYNLELSQVIKKLQTDNKNLLLLGSCSGASQVFNYIINGEGIKPDVIAAFSPQERYKTPFWLPALGWIPDFLMDFVQKMIIVIYRFILKMKRTKESQNVNWAADRLAKNDAWSLRRFVLEFITKYDIRGRQNEISMPIIMFVGEEDYFVNPEISKNFLQHPKSKIVQIKTLLHRIHENNEDKIALGIHNFLNEIV